MIVDCIVAVGRGIRCHWIDTVCVEFRKLTDSKCIRVENWKRPVRFHTQRVRVYMPINQNLPVNRCIPVWLSTFDSQNREEKRTKLLTYVKHVVQMIFEIGYNSSMVFHYSICALAQHGFGFWIKRMHQNHSSNMSLKTELTFRLVLSPVLSLSISAKNILFDINVCCAVLCCIFFSVWHKFSMLLSFGTWITQEICGRLNAFVCCTHPSEINGWNGRKKTNGQTGKC